MPRRYRGADRNAAGLEDLLAQPRRWRRRAAGLRLVEIREPGQRERALPRSGADSRQRRRHDRLQGGVSFPVLLQAVDPARPITLRLGFSYGVCREICIPAEAELALIVPPDGGGPAVEDRQRGAGARAAGEAGPSSGGTRCWSEPSSYSAAKGRTSPLRRIFPGDASAAAGFHRRAPKASTCHCPKSAERGPRSTCVSPSIFPRRGLGELKGSTLVVTMIGDKGHSETHVPDRVAAREVIGVCATTVVCASVPCKA